MYGFCYYSVGKCISNRKVSYQTIIFNNMKRILLTSIFALLLVINHQVIAQNTIDGYVLYRDNPQVPIPDVLVGLYTTGGALISTYTTGTNGFYSFTNVPDGTYVLSSTTNISPGGVDLYDAWLILQYIFGFRTFTPIEFMAADVTGNGVVNMVDYLFIVIHYFIYGQPFPAGAWVFLDVEVSTFSRTGGGNVAGSSTGDVGGVWVPTGRDLINEMVLEYEGIANLQSGQIVSLPIMAHSLIDLAGYGLVFEFDPQMIEIVDVIPYGSEAHFAVVGNQLRMSWIKNNEESSRQNFDGLLATVSVRQKGQAAGDVSFRLGKESHILDNTGEKIGYLELTAPKISIADGQGSSLSLYPMPASGTTNLRMAAAQSGKALVSVFNMQGQMVDQFNLTVSAGTNNFTIDLGNYIPGSYRLIVQTADKQVMKSSLYVQ